jgi:hypothetical protein
MASPPIPVATSAPLAPPAVAAGSTATATSDTDADRPGWIVVRSHDEAIVEPARAAPPRDRRSKRLVGAAAAAVLALGAAGVFAVANLTRSTTGGSETPTDLGSALLTAVESEDVLGVIDVLVPGEREALGQPFVELVSELQRLDVLGPTDLSRIAGLDITLTNEAVRIGPTNVDDIVNVGMAADVEVSVDGATLPIGELITDNLPADMVTEMRGTRLTDTSDFDVTLTAVREDGRWYFSLLHTVAELARADLGGDVGVPLDGIGSQGAETPEAAIDQMLNSIETLDIAGMIRQLDPSEAAALQRYAPLFLDEAEAALDDVPLEWSIDDSSVRIEGSGDRRTVFFDALVINGTIDGSAFSFAFDGECARAELDGEHVEQCGTVGGVSDFEGIFGEQPELTRLIDVVQSAFSDVEPVGLELRLRDGAWFVSPIATATDAMLAFLGALDRQELDSIIEAAKPVFGSFQDGIFGSIEDLSASSDLEVIAPIEPDVPSSIGQSDGAAGADGAGDGWLDCYDLDASDAIVCFESFVTAGDITADYIPVVLRHLECGYAEAAWSGAIYELSDEEFIAAAEAAQPCFFDLVDRGEIEVWELPVEIAHLECFEGRNWYHVFDDPEYDARFEACRSAAESG